MGSTVFRSALIGLYLVGFLALTWFLVRGAGYYLTPFAERPHHPDYALFRPAGVYGLAFGLAGTGLMLALLLYSIRRRTPLFGKKIPLKYWLDVHIWCGVMGPLLIVLHTSFRWTGLVSISFWSMVGVALSGLFGRYLYVQIPRNLQGQELETEGQAALASQLNSHLTRFTALPIEAHTTLIGIVRGRYDRRIDLFHMLEADMTRFFRTLRAKRFLSRFELSPAQVRDLLQGILHIESRTRAALRLKVLHKLLDQWHVIHRPFALIMYLIMCVHIGVALMFGISWR